MALTLRAVAGLPTRRIAALLFTTESAVAQRISRAKATIRAAGHRLTPPTTHDLPRRLNAVRHVLYLIFTAGHTTGSGPDLMDVGLAAEAIRLTDRLHRALWDRAAIDRGTALVESALPRGAVGPFQLQAAVAAVHAQSPTAETTDWLQITMLYRMHERAAPSPAVTLNLAASIGMAHGPDSPEGDREGACAPGVLRVARRDGHRQTLTLDPTRPDH